MNNENQLPAQPTSGGTEEPLKLKFDLSTIDHLGIRLYSQLPAALNELVTNAYDADATTVEIIVPEGKIDEASEITVLDDGNGMSRDEVRSHYLIIGRDRRKASEGGSSISNGGRKVTGRKGLGKLAVFGIASVMHLRTVCGGVVTAFSLDYRKMHETDGDYDPEPLPDDRIRVTEPNGTRITLKSINRTTEIVPVELVEQLGRRLAMIDDGFNVSVNGIEVRNSAEHEKKECKDGWTWDVDQLDAATRAKMPAGVTGWFGFVETSKQAERGVNIFANRKAAAVGSFFNYSGTTVQFARAYLVGEVHADFLDGERDLVATARNGIVWDDPEAQKLEDWGQDALKWLFDQWLTKRRTARSKTLYTCCGMEEWLASRPDRDRKLATKMLDLLAQNHDLDEDRARPLVEIVKSSVETVAFRDLVEEIEQNQGSPVGEVMLRLFGEWKIIEARVFGQIFRGRLGAVEKLCQVIGTDALEVQVMQPLLFDNLWILDPGWKQADRETTYSNLMRTYADGKIPKDEKNRRLDIFAVTASGCITVIEVKRANKVLEFDDLVQIEQYRAKLRSIASSSSKFSPCLINAMLVVGQMEPTLAREVEDRRTMGIEVATWEDLVRRARQIYSEYQEALRIVAPEYAKKFAESLGPPATS